MKIMLPAALSGRGVAGHTSHPGPETLAAAVLQGSKFGLSVLLSASITTNLSYKTE